MKSKESQNGVWHDEYGSKPRVAELIEMQKGNERIHDPDQRLIDSGFDVIAPCRFLRRTGIG